MKRLLLACLCFCAVVPPAGAQPLPRVKGRIVDFDGLTFHLAPLDGSPVLAVRLQQDTVFTTVETRALAGLKIGDWAGATVRDQDGALTAEEVHLYPDALRGSGEGRLPQNDGRSVINGAVTGIGNHDVTLFYKGGSKVEGVCLGRADPSLPSPACSADPRIAVPEATPVTALVPGDRRLLVPGAIATVSIAGDAKGVRVTPGMILEKPQTPP